MHFCHLLLWPVKLRSVQTRVSSQTGINALSAVNPRAILHWSQQPVTGHASTLRHPSAVVASAALLGTGAAERHGRLFSGIACAAVVSLTLAVGPLDVDNWALSTPNPRPFLLPRYHEANRPHRRSVPSADAPQAGAYKRPVVTRRGATGNFPSSGSGRGYPPVVEVNGLSMSRHSSSHPPPPRTPPTRTPRQGCPRKVASTTPRTLATPPG